MIKTSVDAYGSTIYTITDDTSEVCINITRGGIPISWKWQEKEVFYNDMQRYADSSLPIWGGIPILFPSLGKTEGGVYAIGDQRYPMPAHGFVRDMEWELYQTHKDGASFCCTSNAWSKQYFPYDFRLIFRYILRDNTLEIKQSICNTGEHAFAFAAGLHPYFAVSDIRTVSLDMQAKEYEDLLADITKPYEQMSFEHFSTELCYLVQNERTQGTGAYLEADLGERSLQMQYSKEYRYIVLWSVGNDFLCIEPWSARVDALRTGRDVLTLQAGETKELSLSLSVVNR